jgi:hypothetical protein
MQVELEFWMLALSVAAAVIPWAFSIHAKVAVIANSVESLPEIVEEMREALQEHEVRLDEHAEAIAAIQKATRAGG